MPDHADSTSRLLASSEAFLSACELPDALATMGVRGYDERACRSLIKAIRASGTPGVINRRLVRASTAAAWLIANPDWTPYTRREHQPGLFVAST